MDICTFQFKTKKSFDKVAWQLLDTPFKYSTVYGEVCYGIPRCITVWGARAIEDVRYALDEAGISYSVVM